MNANQKTQPFKDDDNLPRLLKAYADKDFVTRQRAIFVYYLCVALIATLIFLITSTTWLHITNPLLGKPQWPVLLPQIGALAVFIISLVLLVKGFYHQVATIMIIGALSAVWVVVINDHSEPMGRLNTISYLFAIIAMVPLLVGRRKSQILFYSFGNVLVYFVFMFFYKDSFNLTESQFRDQLIDVSVALIFVGIVGYNIYSINRKALERATADIQERKNAEEALAKSERKYREMTELLPQAVCEIDLDGRLVFLNQAGFELFGYDAKDIEKGLFAHELLKEKEYLKTNLERIFNGEVLKGNPYTAIAKSGEERHINAYSSLIMENDIPVGVRGVIVDVTEKEKAEVAIKQSQELFKTLIGSAPNIITLTDMEGKYMLVNKAFEKETGLNESQVIGKSSYEVGIGISQDRFNLIKNHLEQNQIIENIEASISIRDTHAIDVSYSCSLVELNSQKAVLSSLVNITEKKKAERELEKYRNQLEMLVQERTEELATANEELSAINDDLYIQRQELERTLEELKNTQQHLIETEKMASLGILTAGVAHEINNPLNFISNGVVALEDYFKTQGAAHAENIKPLTEVIKTGVSRTTIIVKSLNSYSRRDDLPSTRCNVHAVVEDCLVMLHSQYKGRIEIVKNFNEQELFVFANEGKLHQAFLNVLVNAVQAIDKEGKIFITTRTVNSNVYLGIKDTGHGIKEESIKNIFDPFYTTKDPGKGTGLGLSITQSIIKEAGGEVKCVSAANPGAEFEIRLPLHNA